MRCVWDGSYGWLGCVEGLCKGSSRSVGQAVGGLTLLFSVEGLAQGGLTL